MKLKLDVNTIAALALPKGKIDDFAWDAELENFGLRLRRRSDGGLQRSWCVQYRVDGRTRRVKLGTVDKITPTQAREAARRILAKVQLGGDPQAERAARRRQSGQTFAAVAAAYLEARQPRLRPSSFRINRLYLTESYFRPLHGIPISTITRADIAARLAAISRAHSSNTAAAARRAVSTLFAWAIEQGFIDINVVMGTSRPEENEARERVLGDAELAAIWNACEDDDHGRIVRLMMLLGCRRAEVGGMRRSEFDVSRGIWILPRERAKNGRPLTLSLPPAALAIVQSVPDRGRDCLFGDRSERGFASWDIAKKKLDRQLGAVVQPWRLHDLRRTCATGLGELGVEPHIIETVLNHVSGHKAGIAGVYNRAKYENAVKLALARWSEHVLALAEGRKPAGNVVAFA